MRDATLYDVPSWANVLSEEHATDSHLSKLYLDASLLSTCLPSKFSSKTGSVISDFYVVDDIRVMDMLLIGIMVNIASDDHKFDDAYFYIIKEEINAFELVNNSPLLDVYLHELYIAVVTVIDKITESFGLSNKDSASLSDEAVHSGEFWVTEPFTPLLTADGLHLKLLITHYKKMRPHD